MAPLAPVTAMAIERFLSDINCCCGRYEIEDAHVAVHVERLLDLGEVVFADQGLLVGEQHRDTRHAGKINRTEVGYCRQCRQTEDRDDVECARNEQRPRDAEADWDRSQTVSAIELEILASVQDVEASDPGPDREAKEPRLQATPAARRQPSANWRNRHSEAEKELRIAG